jgi:hypothetical protein
MRVTPRRIPTLSIPIGAMARERTFAGREGRRSRLTVAGGAVALLLIHGLLL